jgi:hypothetical protein
MLDCPVVGDLFQQLHDNDHVTVVQPRPQPFRRAISLNESPVLRCVHALSSSDQNLIMTRR